MIDLPLEGDGPTPRWRPASASASFPAATSGAKARPLRIAGGTGHTSASDCAREAPTNPIHDC